MLMVGEPIVLAVGDDAVVAEEVDFLLNMATATPPATPAITQIRIHFFLLLEPPEPELEMVTSGDSLLYGTAELVAGFFVTISTPGVIKPAGVLGAAFRAVGAGSVPGAGGLAASVEATWGGAP